MAATDPERGWWGEQCPQRGPALSHAHSSECGEPAHNGRCCHCLARPGERPSASAVPPPINVNERLRDLGFLPQAGATLTEHEKRVLEVNVLHIQRKRGYR